jgi:hypothetical protein
MRHAFVGALTWPSDIFHEIVGQFRAQSIGANLDRWVRLRISAKDRRRFDTRSFVVVAL